MSEKLFNVGIKAVITQGDKVLLVDNVKRRHDTWEFPGGRMDGNETIEETLRRELTEELPNIKNIKIGALLGAHRIHHDIKEKVSLVLIFYKVEAEFDGEVQISDEHKDFRWVTLNEAKKLAGPWAAELLAAVLDH